MTEFDYIIVGAGSAGCVMANRLSLDSNVRVLVLEAGEMDVHADIAIPNHYQRLLGGELDWGYVTEPEAGLADRKIPIARGKVVGGCSAINAMVYIRGNQQDYDEWQKQGNPGWGYSDLLPLFKKLEHDQLSSSPYPHAPHPLSLAFIESAKALGFPHNKDFNGTHQLGAGLYPTTIKNGRRWSAASAFLHPILQRKNLSVLTQACVTRILFNKKRACGVEYKNQNKINQVYARREIILCAGAFNSPKLLLLSGIGPEEELKKHSIPIRVDLPGVGKNLHDHPWIDIKFISHVPAPGSASNGCEAGLFMTTNNLMDAPDVQIDAALDLLHDSITSHAPTFSFCPINLKPKSRGEVCLRSDDPFAPPIIQMNYLVDEEDFLPLLSGIKLARELSSTPEFAPFLGDELLPGKDVTTDSAMREFIRTNATTLWHAVGTCKMGRDAFSVVNEKLQVHGVEGLRVIDASIMPNITSGNTHAPTLVIAERGAEWVVSQ